MAADTKLLGQRDAKLHRRGPGLDGQRARITILKSQPGPEALALVNAIASDLSFLIPALSKLETIPGSSISVSTETLVRRRRRSTGILLAMLG